MTSKNTIQEKIINRMRKVAGVSALALILVGCSREAKNEKLQEIEGVPVSVSISEGYKGYYSSIASYVYLNGNQDLGMLASAQVSSFGESKNSSQQEKCNDVARTSALIQAEIAKGKNGRVRFYGCASDDGVFEIQIVEAGGYKIDLRR